MKPLKRLVLIVVVLTIVVLGAAYLQLRRSLPELDGSATVAVSSSTTIERDALGSAIITAANRGDAYFAQGYVHAQERFFEMDLTRRSAAGELSALFGAVALPRDRAHRLHRMRARLTAFYPSLPEAQRELLQRYADGVNAGLHALAAKPWSYSLLRATPLAWQPVDTLLVNAAMHFNLQDDTNAAELVADTAKRVYSPAAFQYLFNRTSQIWDAPLLEGMPNELPDPMLPSAAQLDLRALPETLFHAVAAKGSEAVRGSNNWAVGGALTESGSAMLANDMHLGLGVPSIWFRQQLRYRDGVGAQARDWVITGVSLPGAPGTVVGSNGLVAWGNTNSYGDWLDFVRLQKPDGESEKYLDADGAHPITSTVEIIQVKGAEDEQLVVRETAFGPITAKDAEGNELALAWVAHRPGGVNADPVDFELSATALELMQRAKKAGMPHNNVVAADKAGHITWTIGGQIPLRSTFADKGLPVPSATLHGDVWRGFMAQADMQAPEVIDPPNMRLYTANSRVVNQAGLAFLGNGGYALGARASRIRDLLQAQRGYFHENDMLRIQLDDQAPLLEPWWQLLSTRVATMPKYAGVARQLGSWNRRASAESVAYRIVRNFRAEVMAEMLNALGAPVRAKFPEFTLNFPGHAEVMIWPILTSEAPHLLPKPYQNYSEFETACLDRALAKMLGKLKPVTLPSGQISPEPFAPVSITADELTVDALEAHPWGEQNTTRIQHPLAKAIPALSWLLDMPNDAVPGDTGHIVRAQGPAFGASERLSVSPGHEEKGLFHMPGGQSGHPLSPFYGAGHEDWLLGNPTPFLPGKALHKLALLPKR
jgi:penicillin G amidase